MLNYLRHIIGLVLLALLAAVPPASADAVTDWNKSALAVMTEQKWPTVQQARAVAMMEIAVFDAINSINPVYRGYSRVPAAPAGTSQVAAASQAAFRVMSTLDAEHAQLFAALNNAMLGGVADAAARILGVNAGDEAALAILASREGDGFDASADYTPLPSGAGVYQPTSPGPMIGLRFARMRPFALAKADQFRPPPPPALNAPQFLRDLQEVRERGGIASLRTPDETLIAKFHAPPGLLVWNEIARQAVDQHLPGLLVSARALALLNIALCDGFSAGYDTKYTYNFWRPATAIASGGAGFDHSEIASDPAWRSLVPAPLHPEYMCSHCNLGAAATAVLEAFFPDQSDFVIVQGSVTRQFAGFRAYAAEEAESRILAGVHFRWSVIVGDALGQQVAREALKLMPPR